MSIHVGTSLLDEKEIERRPLRKYRRLEVDCSAEVVVALRLRQEKLQISNVGLKEASRPAES
jgi:hypothetical protein